MRILSFEIDGLFGRDGMIRSDFNYDLNILTGRNGAGKTSVLKLLWSVVSGNILIGLNEVPYRTLRVVTDEYDCFVVRLGKNTCRIEFSRGGRLFIFEDDADEDQGFFQNAEDRANEILRDVGSSIFFPTFRRIEGGFSINPARPGGSTVIARQNRARGDLDEAFGLLARNLTNNNHQFISAISTTDVVTLLLRRFAILSEEANLLQAETSRNVINQIKDLRREGDDASQLLEARQLLENVRLEIEEMEGKRQKTMAPFQEMKGLVERLFQHTGINIGARISFGDAATAVNSDVLSAGEKQMLSFVCYNAFNHDGIIFIDEPELSLHVDWQRQLFGILRRQDSSNQFIITTHSPFIYGKYPDKEIKISTDRGEGAD